MMHRKRVPMDRAPSLIHVFGTLVSAVLVIIGSWLPWVRKIPAGYVEGQPYYTDEWVRGLEPGFQALDYILVLLVFTAVAAPVLARYQGLSTSGIVISSGTLILLIAGGHLTNYLGRYIIEPGLYLVLLSGIILVIIGLFTTRKHAPSNQVSGFSWRREN